MSVKRTLYVGLDVIGFLEQHGTLKLNCQ